MKLEDAFEFTIKHVFGEEVLGSEDLRKRYTKIQGSKETYGKYGDDAAIDLMLYLRKLMRDRNLVPNIRMDENMEEFINKNIRGKDNWLTEEYKNRFPQSYDSEPDSHFDGDYDVDGWNYENADITDRETEWIGDYKKYKNTHYYYNQLDHYLTYLVDRIRSGKTKNDSIRKGHIIKKDIYL